jgi:hypothetical protein
VATAGSNFSRVRARLAPAWADAQGLRTSIRAIDFFRWTARSTSAMIDSSSQLLRGKSRELVVCLPALLRHANLLTSLFIAITELQLWPHAGVCSSHSEQEIP